MALFPRRPVENHPQSNSYQHALKIEKVFFELDLPIMAGILLKTFFLIFFDASFRSNKSPSSPGAGSRLFTNLALEPPLHGIKRTVRRQPGSYRLDAP